MNDTRRDGRKRRQQAGNGGDRLRRSEKPMVKGNAASRWLPFLLALASAMLVWTALPPLGWWPLGWIAPLGWLVLIQFEKLPGRRPYWGIYFASVLVWALVMQGIRLAHWANYLGLVALSLYLGIYLPLFIAIARVAHHRWRVPLVVATPVVWVGVEVVRGYGPLAFSMALLAHTQTPQPILIQAADVFGPYGVSFAIMFIAACLLRIVPETRRGWAFTPIIPAVMLVILLLAYGQYRLTQSPPFEKRAPLRVALIQGSIDTVFGGEDRRLETQEQYAELTQRAVREFQPLDLVLWPETMFPIDDVLVDVDGVPQLDPSMSPELVEDTRYAFGQLVVNGARRLNPPNEPAGHHRPTHWVFGASTWKLGDHPSRRYNAAIWANPEGEVVGRYYKMRPVIFGEYVPFGDTFPALYNLFPLPGGLTSGEEPAAWEIGGIILSPSICFENTMPHLLRWQVVELTRRGQRPDVLVNLTNDGWFWGSSILDMQLDCAVFRAVELRRPFLVAANTGFSAWIDGNGTVLAKGPRRDTDSLFAEVVPDGRRGLYEVWGDIPVLVCTLFCIIVAVSGLWRREKIEKMMSEE